MYRKPFLINENCNCKDWYVNQTKSYLDQKHLPYIMREADTGSVYVEIGENSDEYKAILRISTHPTGYGYVRTIRCDQRVKNAQGKIADLRRVIDEEISKAKNKNLRKLLGV